MNLAPYIESFAAAAKENGWSGWSMDWETAAQYIPTGVNGTGPWGNGSGWDPIGTGIANFSRFVDLNTNVANGMHQHG